MPTPPPSSNHFGPDEDSWLGPRIEQSGLSRYIDAVRARIWIVVGCVVVTLVAATVYVALAPRTYKAEADLLATPVAADDPNLVGLPLVRSTADPTADVLTVSKLVSSPAVAERVATRLHLRSTPTALLQQIESIPVTQSQIVAVTATTDNPQRSAALANAFVRETIAERTERLHTQLRTMVPKLKATIAHTPRADRSALNQQLAVLQTLLAGPDPTLRVSSTAQTPTAAAWPRTGLSLAAGGFAGLVLGLLAALVLQGLDPRLRNEDQLRELYELPVLARLPVQRGSDRPISPTELTAPSAEAFRTLRTAFTLDAEEGVEGRAILVSGDSPGQGKTTVALNLASALVAAGKQVILIEADLRRPTIGRALGVSSQYGTTQVLLGEVELADALIWSRSHGPQLEMLLADRCDSRSVDSLSAPGVRRLLRDAREIADYVIIDSPPLTGISDALVFAENADEVLLVARIGQSRLRKLADLGDMLVRHRVRPAGVVLVGVERGEVEDYYYYADGATAGERRPVQPAEMAVNGHSNGNGNGNRAATAEAVLRTQLNGVNGGASRLSDPRRDIGHERHESALFGLLARRPDETEELVRG